MRWNISTKFEPGEEIVEEQSEKRLIKAVYTPILTNRRALFRFNSLSTSLVQSFRYEEIASAQMAVRLMVKYLKLNSKGKDYFLNVPDPDSLGARLMELKGIYAEKPGEKPAAVKKYSLGELLAMLEALREYGLLTAEEFSEKRKLISG